MRRRHRKMTGQAPTAPTWWRRGMRFDEALAAVKAEGAARREAKHFRGLYRAEVTRRAVAEVAAEAKALAEARAREEDEEEAAWARHLLAVRHAQEAHAVDRLRANGHPL